MPFVERSGARIHYTASGRGPALLLVQGAGVIGEGWRPQIDAFEPDYRVISIDNRGIGQSSLAVRRLTIEDMAEDVLAVADAERTERFHLAGHSMGGLIAQQIALSARARVLSLALLCTFSKGSQATAMSAALLWIAIRARVGTRRMRRRAFVEMVMPRRYLSTVDRDDLCRRLEQLFGRDLADQPPIVMTQLRAMRAFDASRQLSSLAGLPTLVASATEDRIARPEYGRALAAAIPGAEFVEFTGAGHAVTIQCAAAVNDRLRSHLRSASTLTST